MHITDTDALLTYLTQVQQTRAEEVRCQLAQPLAARLSDAAIDELLVTGLPMVQGVSRRIVRSRGQGALLTAKLRYREGVRMLTHWQCAGHTKLVLDYTEYLGLARACDVAAEAFRLTGNQARFDHVYRWLCGNVRYVHTAPGRKGYEQLIGAGGAMVHHAANCQGFADALYLLCGLCGIPCEYRLGRGERKLHVWNAVCLDGVWQEVDASRGARQASAAIAL